MWRAVSGCFAEALKVWDGNPLGLKAQEREKAADSHYIGGPVDSTKPTHLSGVARVGSHENERIVPAGK